MSDSLFKANRIVVKSEGKKVIDSNGIVAKRLEMLAEILERQNTEPSADDFTEGFIEGLDATQVEMLLSDNSEGFEEGYEDGYQEASEDMSQVFAGTNAQIQQMLEDAQTQAEEIINSARMEAESVLAAAQDESAGIRENASREGYEEGFNAGHQEGLNKISEMEQELNARAEEMEREHEALMAELEPMFIENLSAIYSHVFNVDLSKETGIIIHLLKNAIHNIDGTKSYFIHVSKDDYDSVHAAKDELASGLGTQVVIEIIEDMTLKASECFIEADSGIFDCSLGTELELLRKELILLSYQKEN